MLRNTSAFTDPAPRMEGGTVRRALVRIRLNREGHYRNGSWKICFA